MYDSILVATDGSDAATAAVEHAIELARRFDAPLHGVSVLESRTEYDNAIVDPEEAERRRRERAESTLADLESAAGGSGADSDADAVPVETAIRTGVPHEEILAYADEHDIGAIVVGSRGRSSFKGALLGSTVDAVVRRANRPVLVVDGTDTE